MLVLCPYPHGVAAGQRLKFEQYYDDWRAAGWEVDVAPFMDTAPVARAVRARPFRRKFAGVTKGYLRRLRDLFRLGRYDLVYCHMYVTPLGTSLAERLTRALAPKLVYDVEDNVMAHVDRFDRDHPNRLLRFLRASGKYSFLVREADHVVTSSPALNERCKTINRRAACTYISSSVDTDRFLPANRYSNDGLVTIGWTGTFSSRQYLDLLRGVLQELAQQRRFRLRVIGNFDYALPGVDLEVVRWTAEREIEDLQAIDIGLYPLPADEWVSGKSGLKAIQYMAMGLPCVATDVGTTPLIIRDGENGLLVRSEEEWLNALDALARRSGAAPPAGRGGAAGRRRKIFDESHRRASIARSCRARWRVEREWKRASASTWPGPAGCSARHSTASSAARTSSDAPTRTSMPTGCGFLDFRDFDAYREDVLGVRARLSLPPRRLHRASNIARSIPTTLMRPTRWRWRMRSTSPTSSTFLCSTSAPRASSTARKETYDDWDQPNPLGHYARSKYMGERFVAENVPRSTSSAAPAG